MVGSVQKVFLAVEGNDSHHTEVVSIFLSSSLQSIEMGYKETFELAFPTTVVTVAMVSEESLFFLFFCFLQIAMEMHTSTIITHTEIHETITIVLTLSSLLENGVFSFDSGSIFGFDLGISSVIIGVYGVDPGTGLTLGSSVDVMIPRMFFW